MLHVKEIQAKSVLNKSKIFDYCLNPYTGCQINCRYCYARLFMKRYSGHKEAWGDFVDVKINAPEVLQKQLGKAKRGTVWISSVCDPYQPLEATYELTRRCLKELVKKQFPVNIQTKSELVLRDLDLFKEFEEIEVGFTITTDDEKVAKLFEHGKKQSGGFGKNSRFRNQNICFHRTAAARKSGKADRKSCRKG
jgi:DNA repair photolyase